MRLYLPLTLPQLRGFVDAGLAGPIPGHGVTASLRSALPEEGDEEVLEFYALTLAADESAAAVRQDPGSPQRRLVLAVDVAESAVRDDVDRGPGAVLADGPIGAAELAALHVDDAAAEAAVAAAGDLDDFDLLWYAPQEVADLLAAHWRDPHPG